METRHANASVSRSKTRVIASARRRFSGVGKHSKSRSKRVVEEGDPKVRSIGFERGHALQLRETRERHTRFSSKQSRSESCSITRFNYDADFARKTTRKTIHSRAGRCKAHAKATLKEREEALRKRCIEHVQRDFA